jgi:4'-phosphopantetheinyl transferase
MTPTLIRVARIAEVLAALPDESHSWLSPTEQTRLQRLQIASRRAQYLSGHWLARSLLAELRGGRPGDWQLDERPSLPPAVIGQHHDLHLSISHSADWIACAVSTSAIGIDIEQRHPPRDALHRFEHLLLADGDTPGTLSADELLQRWVAKEAWIKRHHGSALPDQLQAMKLRRAAGMAGDVRMFAASALYLAVAAGDAPSPLIDNERFSGPVHAWCIDDSPVEPAAQSDR